MGRSFNFPTSLRLKSKKQIEQLFTASQYITVSPLLIKYLILPTEGEIAMPPKVAFAVPKKKFPKAVVRNKLKRKMREAYRLNWRQKLVDLPNNKEIILILLYHSKEIMSYQKIETALILGLDKLMKSM
ncbi:MAG: ribonuclease P protein component [Saprospiraceae bacterium]